MTSFVPWFYIVRGIRRYYMLVQDSPPDNALSAHSGGRYHTANSHLATNQVLMRGLATSSRTVEIITRWCPHKFHFTTLQCKNRLRTLSSKWRPRYQKPAKLFNTVTSTDTWRGAWHLSHFMAKNFQTTSNWDSRKKTWTAHSYS